MYLHISKIVIKNIFTLNFNKYLLITEFVLINHFKLKLYLSYLIPLSQDKVKKFKIQL